MPVISEPSLYATSRADKVVTQEENPSKYIFFLAALHSGRLWRQTVSILKAR